jgi:hypothetical protein
MDRLRDESGKRRGFRKRTALKLMSNALHRRRGKRGDLNAYVQKWDEYFFLGSLQIALHTRHPYPCYWQDHDCVRE